MAQSETSENGHSETNAVERPAEGERGAAGRAEGERPTRRFPSTRGSAVDRQRAVNSLRETEFPVALRGYERAAVDRYVESANRLIAELEISSSPEAAVRHALDEVSEETRELLQRAHQTAEEITARSRSKADDRLQQAEREAEALRADAAAEAAQTRELAMREAHELRDTAAREVHEQRETAQREVTELREAATREAQQVRAAAQRDAEEARATARQDAEEMLDAAETRTRELARSAEKVWRERRRLIEDMRSVADQLVAVGEAEANRFPRFDFDDLVAGENRAAPTAASEDAPA